MAHNQALVLARSGRMREARTLWTRAVAMAQQDGRREVAATYEAAQAVCEAHFENAGAARTWAQSALDLAKGRDVEFAAAFALALSGDSAGSQHLAEDLAKRFPEDTPVQFEYLPTLRALSAISRKAPLDAIQRLETALPYDLAMSGTSFFAKFGGLYPAYVRGQAYLEAGRGREAAAEFQKGRIPEGPGSSRDRACRSGRRFGALAIGESLRCVGRHDQSEERLPGFPHALEGCRRGHPDPQKGQGGIREAIVISRRYSPVGKAEFCGARIDYIGRLSALASIQFDGMLPSRTLAQVVPSNRSTSRIAF